MDPLWMTWSVHHCGEQLGSQIPAGVDGEGFHDAGLGTLSGSYADLPQPPWEAWEVSQSHHPASFHPLRICPSSTQVLGTRDQTPSLLQEAANNQGHNPHSISGQVSGSGMSTDTKFRIFVEPLGKRSPSLALSHGGHT